ncbi:MAG: sodium:solute symporter family protein [candidate division KSB1 bacterium]|jgi:Na+/proline symporter|nr:sodium:solute symporter family protein [candidate division KSB1 bacterium]
MNAIEPVEFSIQCNIHVIDWLIIGAFLVISLLIGLYFSRRGQKNLVEYFASGRGVSWWVLGTSMVATTFAADTPLAISGLFVKQGIWGNWFWWSQIPMFVGGVFLFSRLWRRTRILTDAELIDIRYSGKSSKVLRGFRAVYLAIPYNCLVMGWVILSMTKILGLTFNVPKHWAVIICIIITLTYSAMSGLWGVVATDFFQFILAISMAIYLAVVSVDAAGGFATIFTQLSEIYSPERAESMLSLIPSINSPQHAFHIFLLYILLLWWTVGNTDGGLYFAQRMLSARDERHSFFGYLWFNIAHFCIRPWPWIIVGMVAAVMFPGIATRDAITGQLKPDPELGYIAVMITCLKPGFLGLMLASFLAAFMSTISTQLNWGASYLVNDLYRPFIAKNASDKHYVRVSVGLVVLMAFIGGGVSFLMHDIFLGWLLLSAINAGIGIVYIARWYWWRVNAWSEISATSAILIVMAAALICPSDTQMKKILIALVCVPPVALLTKALIDSVWRKRHTLLIIPIIAASTLTILLIDRYTLPDKVFPWTLLYTVPISLIIWISFTFITKQVDEEKLVQFYRQVRPGGIGWLRIARKIQEDFSNDSLFTVVNFRNAILCIIAVSSALFLTGKLILGDYITAAILILVITVCVIIIAKSLSGQHWGSD